MTKIALKTKEAKVKASNDSKCLDESKIIVILDKGAIPVSGCHYCKLKWEQIV